MNYALSLRIVVGLGLTSCATTNHSDAPMPMVPTLPQITDTREGPWKNRHAGDPQLAGVRVQQFPDCSFEGARFQGAHPAMILYVMWDGRVHQTNHEPDGTTTSDFWWSIGSGTHQYLWDQLNYLVGSDPEFKTHKDPRRG
jgi:hypothetical protein